MLILSFFVFVSLLWVQILFTTQNVKETYDNGRTDNRRKLEATKSRLNRTKNRAILRYMDFLLFDNTGTDPTDL